MSTLQFVLPGDAVRRIAPSAKSDQHYYACNSTRWERNEGKTTVRRKDVPSNERNIEMYVE